MPLTAAMIQTDRTREIENAFFEALGDLGNVFAACKSSGMPRSQVYTRKESDPEFIRRYNEALAKNLADFEMELKRRAVHGVDDPVYHKGKVVGHRKKHSDNLMMFSLSALHPEKYRQKFDVTGSVQHNHKAELPEAVLSILDSLKAVNVTPVECSTWNNGETQQIEDVTPLQCLEEGLTHGSAAGERDGQIDHGQGRPAGWTVRKVEGHQQSHQATVKVHRYGVE